MAQFSPGFDPRKIYLIKFQMALPVWALQKIMALLPQDTVLVGCDRDFHNQNNFIALSSDRFPASDLNASAPELFAELTVTDPLKPQESSRVKLKVWNKETLAFDEVVFDE